MNIALINRGKVENIIVADLEFARELGYEQAVDVTDQHVEIGMLFNGEIFIKPEIVPISEAVPTLELPTERYISQNQMLKRFTVAEFTSILTASKASVMVEYWLVRFNALKDGVNLNDPEVTQGLKDLETAGLIAQGRANEILQ